MFDDIKEFDDVKEYKSENDGVDDNEIELLANILAFNEYMDKEEYEDASYIRKNILDLVKDKNGDFYG